VRSASVSKISTAGPPAAIRAATTGAAASVRSPEKPAAQPTRRIDGGHASPRSLNAAFGAAGRDSRTQRQFREFERKDGLIRNANECLDPPAARFRHARRAAQLHARGALTHLSQPAFSALIRSLEEAIGQRLFDRSTRMST
jgi:hypothetical protein